MPGDLNNLNGGTVHKMVFWENWELPDVPYIFPVLTCPLQNLLLLVGRFHSLFSRLSVLTNKVLQEYCPTPFGFCDRTVCIHLFEIAFEVVHGGQFEVYLN